MKKKLIVLPLILFIIVFSMALLGYFFGYIPLVGRVYAQHKLEKYLGYKIEMPVYNPVDSMYVYEDGNSKYGYNLKRNTIYDPKVTDKTNKELEAFYQRYKEETMASGISLPETVSAWVETDTYDTAKRYLKIHFLVIEDKDALDDDASRSNFVTVVDDFISALPDAFNITGIHSRYSSSCGMYDIHSDMSKNRLLEQFREEDAEKIESFTGKR